MTQHVDIFKLANIQSVVEISKAITKGDVNISEFDFSKMVQGHAMLTKRADESVGNAFERILTAPTPEGVELRKAYVACKGMVSKPTPANTEVIKAESLEAIKELQSVADKNGLSFEQVFQDSAYAKLAASTYSYH